MIEASLSEDPVRQAPIKIDRNLRKALLKALADLDTESAEQKSANESRGTKLDEIDLSPSDETSQSRDEQTREPTRTIFSFDDFPNEEETPNEEKLQNSTFVESDKYEGSDNPRLTTTTEILKSHDTSNLNNNRAFQAHDVILKDKSSAIYDKSPEIVYDQLETRSVKTSSAPINIIDNSGEKPSENYRESLAISSSNGIATANALVPPSPTPSSPTASTSRSTNSTSQVSSSSSSSTSEATKTTSKDEQEVKIFQAPLVAAFTVQQDERGVPKSIVPIYRPNGDGQTLSLQEQLDFKQQLLERQLAELQAQQIQQTQFLVRQQQIYEQQLRQKQQQQLFFQEQTRLKQLQEEQARLKQLEEQRNYQFQAQKSSQLFAQSQQNGRSPLQLPFKSSNVNVQPSLTLELPKTAVAPAFQTNFHDQQRIQQLRQQQLQQQQQAQHLQLQQQRQQQLLQQQRLQQSFSSFSTDFQPPSAGPAQRFNRQEAFGAVGNFGFNDNRQQHASSQRNHFAFNSQLSRGPQTFSYNPHHTQQLQQQQYRSQRPQTPAKQIQHLLYQSGVAGNLGTVQGTGGQEDLNIVSKVLALNVGALPNKNGRYNNFGNKAWNLQFLTDDT